MVYKYYYQFESPKCFLILPEEYVPGGHGEQAVLPLLGEKVFTGHTEQERECARPVCKYPAAHRQVEDASDENDPYGHAVQVVEPFVENVFAGHGL